MKYLMIIVGLILGNTSSNAYALAYIKPGTSVDLIANFGNTKSFAGVVEENKCKMAINGGFYDTTNRPLGYFANSGKVLRRSINSGLFNGYMYEQDGKFGIAQRLPNKTIEWGLQTGPLLIENGKFKKLQMANDKVARRMVAAILANGQMVWLTIYDGNSVFDGPKLADLPQVVKDIGKKEKLDIVTAINLDGGTASAFYSPEKKLYEFNPVGSVLCSNDAVRRR